MVTYFIIACIVLLFYYIFKIYFNHKLKQILLAVNFIFIASIISIYMFSDNQLLFDFMFAGECVSLLVCSYYFFDKCNFGLYNILAQTKAIPIVIGSSWFFKGRIEIASIIEFFNKNPLLMNNNKEILMILINRNEKNTDVILQLNKQLNSNYFKDNIVPDNTFKMKSKGRLIVFSVNKRF